MEKQLTILVLSAVLQLSTGFSPSDKTQFIVGGERANIADFPHQLALLDLSRGGYWCGASNIHRLWALSAAHCLHSGTAASLINLYGGSNSRLTGGQLFFVERYILHPSYSRFTLDNDIAVLAVHPNTPLEGFAHVRPIPLPPTCASGCCGICPQGSNIDVAGWGRVDDGSLPEFLMQVSKPVISNEDCAPFWRTLTPRMFCTLVEQGRDSCNGDSGSAVVRDGVQVGIVSFGSSVCGDGSRPAVYVNVENPTIRSFITEHAGI